MSEEFEEVKAQCPTPHNEAKKGEIAKTVLFPGDPLRAKFIAETYLENVHQFNSVRNMLGFTGTYKGVEVSVMGSGMGIPSATLYATELFCHYDVDNVIRIGTTGSLNPDANLGDLYIAQGASTNSCVVTEYAPTGLHFAPIADFHLLRKSIEIADRLGIGYDVGNLYSSDLFYKEDPDLIDSLRRLGCNAIDMEAAGLYTVATWYKKRALAMCMVSDVLGTDKCTTSKERERSFTNMIEIALEMAKELAEE